MVKKNLLALLTVLCLLMAAACLAEEDVQVDVTFDGYAQAGGLLYVTWADEACETGGLGMIGTPGQSIGDMLQSNGVLSVEPVLEGDEFEGWMEAAVTVSADEDGFEWEEYSLVSDQLYTTEELMTLAVPEHRVTYVAKWAGIPAENYFAPYEEETIVMPSITLLSGDGTLLIEGEEETYEAAWRVATVEPGQTFGEALELDSITVLADGKTFAGWTVYEYDVETMETSETHVEEEGALCFELFEDYHMVLREYAVCADLLSNEELAEYVCAQSDHVVVAAWTTEYLTFIKEQSDAMKTSLEQDALTQTDMNLKSEELRTLWDEALNHLMDEAKKCLSEDEMEKLTAEHTAWTADMKTAVELAGKEVAGGSLYPLVVNTEWAKLTEERVYKLHELLQ